MAVYNLGEGEWVNIQKRIDFTSSKVVKNANQVAVKYRKLKRMMRKDFHRVNNRAKMANKYDWLLYGLRMLNKQNPDVIGLKDADFEVLKRSR